MTKYIIESEYCSTFGMDVHARTTTVKGIDRFIGEPGQILRRGGRGGHALWYDFHCGRRLSLESDLSLSQILGDGHIRFTAASMRCGPYTNISDMIK